MKCASCGFDFVGRRCSVCGTLPDVHIVKPGLEDILASKKFQRRLFTSAPVKKVRFAGDEVPWNEWK